MNPRRRFVPVAGASAATTLTSGLPARDDEPLTGDGALYQLRQIGLCFLDIDDAHGA